MRVTEIFHSIEGEGIEIGRPEVFIRLAGCNLRCSWCDTKYSWNEGREMSVNEIVTQVDGYPCKNVSITGGEPLLQRDELLELIRKLKEKDFWIQINTNGTIFDQKILELVDLITMDCKCPSSKMNSDFEVLEKTKRLFNLKTQFKFIISNHEDYKFAKNIFLSRLHDALNIIFQPEWKNRKITKRLVEHVKNDGLRVKVILQQQKIIWRTKRGI